MQLPYKARYGGAKFSRGWEKLMYGSLTFLWATSRRSLSCCSTIQEAGTESETPIPTAEVDPCVAATSSACSFNPIDLGTIQSPSSLSNKQKYQILSTIPAKPKEYPVNSQKQHYQLYWTQQFPWVRYSASLDGVFCGPCFLFSQVRFNSEFVFSPVHNKKNVVGNSHGIFNRHSQSQTHKQCMDQAVSFIAVMKQSIKSQLSEAYEKQV